MNRITGMMIVDVNGANVNGCFEGGAPRRLNDGRGWINSSTISRKIRDMMSDHESPAFLEIQRRVGFDPNRFHVFDSLIRGEAKDNDPIRAKNNAIELGRKDPEAFLDKFWDFRLFGGLPITDEDKEVAAAGGGRVPSRTGCVSFSNAYSVSQVNIVEATITKKASLRDDLLSIRKNDVAPSAKKFVEHGLYVCSFGFVPNLAPRTKAIEQDIEVLKVALPYVFSTSTSASRPSGSVEIINIWWAVHENALGSFSTRKFKEAMMPIRNGDNPMEASSSINDYTIPDEMSLPVSAINLID